MTTDETTTVNLRINDVYSFQYNDAEVKKRFEPYHCFDEQLIVKKRNGKLILKDTYWLMAITAHLRLKRHCRKER